MKSARVGAGAKLIDLSSNTKFVRQSTGSPTFAQARRVNDPVFRRAVDALHSLDPRALGELLESVGADQEILDGSARLATDQLQVTRGYGWTVFIFPVASS